MRYRSFLSTFAFFVAVSFPAWSQSFNGAFDGLGDNDQPIQIEADQFEVFDSQNTAVLTGNVSVVQGDTILKARTLKVFYFRSGENASNESGVRKIEAEGRVAVRSQGNRATADRAVVDLVAEIVTMTGNVLLSQGKNVAEGCTLTVNLKTSVSKIQPCGGTSASSGGRVKILLDPKSRRTN